MEEWLMNPQFSAMYTSNEQHCIILFSSFPIPPLASHDSGAACTGPPRFPVTHTQSAPALPQHPMNRAPAFPIFPLASHDLCRAWTGPPELLPPPSAPAAIPCDAPVFFIQDPLFLLNNACILRLPQQPGQPKIVIIK